MGKVKLEPMKGGAVKKPKLAKAMAKSKAKAPAKRAKKAGGGGSGGGKSGGKEGILTALAELKAVGMHQPSRTLVAHFAKYNGAEQAGFKKALSQMSKEGLVEYASAGSLEITAKGESQVSAHLEPPQNNADIHERIKAMLAPKAAAIFDVLADGEVHTRLEIAKATGYPNANTPGFKKMLSTVGRLEFVEYPSPTTARLKDTAFPFGRDGAGMAPPEKVASSKPTKTASSPVKAPKKEPPASSRAAKSTSPPPLPKTVSAGDDDNEPDVAEDEEAPMEEEEQDGVDGEHEEDEEHPCGDEPNDNEEEELANDDDEEEEVDDDDEQNDSDSEWEG